MEIVTYLLADYAVVDATNKMSIIGAFDRIAASSFPYTHSSMHLALRIRAELGEVSAKRKLRIHLVGEHGLKMGNWEMDFEIPQSIQGRRPVFQLTIGFQNLVFPEPGLYEFIMFIDKEQKALLELDIVGPTSQDN